MYHKLPDHQQLAISFSPTDPCEVHGLLCGLLCADSGLNNSTWLAHLQQLYQHDLNTISDSLQELFTTTRFQLNDEEFGFELLLPDDDNDLTVRATALADWCQGLLSGLGLGGLQQSMVLIEEVQEFLHDVNDIAQVGFDAVDADEEDEQAYNEIIEYLRIGVLMLNQTLQHESGATSPTIH